MSESEGYDYRIELSNSVIETNDEAVALDILGWIEDADGEPDIDVDRLRTLRDAFQRKAGNSSYDHAGRAAYQDAFEKLDAIVRGESWTESP